MQSNKLHQLLISSFFSSSQLQSRFLASTTVGRTANPNEYPCYVSDPPSKKSPFRPGVLQQNRPNNTKAQNEEVICVGLDGSPLPEDEKEKSNGGRRRNTRDEEEEDDKEYFKHHKASPLSELKIADTRKPMLKATDGTATAAEYGGGGVILWSPEQMDTAEDSLRRVMEIWKENAMRGDPDSPHGRVLRSMRREYW